VGALDVVRSLVRFGTSFHFTSMRLNTGLHKSDRFFRSACARDLEPLVSLLVVGDEERLKMGLRTCTVSCCDLNSVEHAVEITAGTLYEAVALALRLFRENDWVGEIGQCLTTIKVVVKQPPVAHHVRVKDFDRWLEAPGKTPAEITMKARLREIVHK
jgi:hypothetical protein